MLGVIYQRFNLFSFNAVVLRCFPCSACVFFNVFFLYKPDQFLSVIKSLIIIIITISVIIFTFTDFY